MKNMDETKESIDYEGIDTGSFSAFQHLIHVLLGENGCPWDRAQTFETIKPCMIDEMTETIAGINTYYQDGNADNFCEELGDILLHIALLTDMAEKQGLFSMEDVVRGIGHKMLRRHPHVFGEYARRGWKNGTLGSDEALPVTWSEIKQVEKKARTDADKAAEKESVRAAADEVIHYLSGSQKS